MVSMGKGCIPVLDIGSTILSLQSIVTMHGEGRKLVFRPCWLKPDWLSICMTLSNYIMLWSAIVPNNLANVFTCMELKVCFLCLLKKLQSIAAMFLPLGVVSLLQLAKPIDNVPFTMDELQFDLTSQVPGFESCGTHLCTCCHVEI